MTQNRDPNIASELSHRLDSLFSDTGDPAPGMAGAAPPAEPESESSDGAMDSGANEEDRSSAAGVISEKSPLFELHGIILSIDWEITDETMKRLLEETERLKTVYKKEKLPLMFLQLHGSVGKYISTRKASAHPDSIKLLHSIFSGLQRILTSEPMTEAEKKKILAVEVDKFKRLKEQILIAKTDGAAVRKKQPAKAPEPPPPAPIEERFEKEESTIEASGHESGTEDADFEVDRIQEAVDELKRFIKEEIASLRKDLNALL